MSEAPAADERSPYARHYDLGFTVGLNGGQVAACPYPRSTFDRVRIARRMAWMEGFTDGNRARAKIVSTSKIRATRLRPKSKPKPAPKPAAAHPSKIIGIARATRRRRALAGHPERYVDKRLRQIATEHAPPHTTAR